MSLTIHQSKLLSGKHNRSVKLKVTPYRHGTYWTA